MSTLLATLRAATPGIGRLALAGVFAAVWSVGVCLAVVTTIAITAWAAAPHGGFGDEIGDVLRAAAQFWLAAHHVGVEVAGERVGLLPLGLIALPGAFLLRSGDWLARVTQVNRVRQVPAVVLGLGLPYAGLATLVAWLSATDKAPQSPAMAAAAGFGVGCCAGGAGVIRTIGVRRVLALLPEWVRRLALAAAGGVASLVVAGSLLVGLSLVLHLSRAREAAEMLAPGMVGGALLLLLQIALVPNAICWGIAYVLGPGFTVGTGTFVAPTGVRVAELPALPLFAAIPEHETAVPVSVTVFAAPVVAGVVTGVLVVRESQVGHRGAGLARVETESTRAVWGLASGGCVGLVIGVLAALSAGPLGVDRLAFVGPSAWKVALVAVAELGSVAAVTAWVSGPTWTGDTLRARARGVFSNGVRGLASGRSRPSP